ncbi:beta-lactamase family protein [Flavobacterium jejuense]|uniref:Beta-lactamase family protein n=1 Tax=Flavobacterium jejuense TaxID=1544455 RepID=A0ABX0IQL2_9FLAO|nr:serine hydrolase domain-containing protein [Flavobacterium jejuense]NHN24763.1 beta-lactamase family protein [Flavobacterium jejuense]
MIKIYLLNLLISFLSYQNQNKDTIDTYLNTLHKEEKLNGNVLIIQNGKTLYEKSFGYTDGSKNTKLSKEYKFNIGSVYKEFPAVSIMQLEQNKLIHLDDKVSKYIPDLPQWSEKVTLKNLLQYSSGLPLINWNQYFSKGNNVTFEDVFKDLQALDTLQFEPGTNYLYSNNNPILLIKIIENVSNMKFEEYLQKHICIPFHLKNIILKEQYPFIDKNKMAIPFDTHFKEDNYKIAIKNIILTTTARDIASWFEQLDTYKIINKESIKTLSETVITGDNIQSPLGSCTWKNNTIIKHAHHGSSGNYECLVSRFNQDGITIVILTNQKNGNVHEITDTIYKILKKDI